MVYWGTFKIIAVWSHNHKAIIPALSSHFEKLVQTERGIYCLCALKVYEIWYINTVDVYF